MTFSGPKRKAFEEDKVQTLWKAAQQASFTPEELESLRVMLLLPLQFQTNYFMPLCTTDGTKALRTKSTEATLPASSTWSSYEHS